MSGVLSRLGLVGGVPRGESVCMRWVAETALVGEGDLAVDLEKLRDSRQLGSAVVETLAVTCFADDFRGGGLSGGAWSFFLRIFLSVPRTVELDDEEVSDSRTAASPSGSAFIGLTPPEKLPPLLLVTGGRVCAGLPFWRNRGWVNPRGAIRPGDWEAMEVGVVSRL